VVNCTQALPRKNAVDRKVEKVNYRQPLLSARRALVAELTNTMARLRDVFLGDALFQEKKCSHFRPPIKADSD